MPVKGDYAQTSGVPEIDSSDDAVGTFPVTRVTQSGQQCSAHLTPDDWMCNELVRELSLAWQSAAHSLDWVHSSMSRRAGSVRSFTSFVDREADVHAASCEGPDHRLRRRGRISRG